MPALKPTEFEAEVVWLGTVPEAQKGIASAAIDHVMVGFDGFPGEKHAGLTRKSCARVRSQHPRGTEIRNTRQICVVSQEELDEIAVAMQVDRIAPEHVGASVVLRGIPDFTHVPPSSRLQGPSGVTFIVDMENRPCHLPAREIDTTHPGEGGKFKVAARNKRGVTVGVERPGLLKLGDALRLHIPDQRVWAHLDVARAS